MVLDQGALFLLGLWGEQCGMSAVFLLNTSKGVGRDVTLLIINPTLVVSSAYQSSEQGSVMKFLPQSISSLLRLTISQSAVFSIYEHMFLED